MEKKTNKVSQQIKIDEVRSNDLYFNRELSLIEFNRRVLLEAEGNKHPILERLKFASIFSSNLDEFFMVRVAGLKQQIAAGVVDLSFDGMTPLEQLTEIRRRLNPLYAFQDKLINDSILPELEKSGIFIDRFEVLSNENKKILENFFLHDIFPILTPLSLDSAHPFPRVLNRSLNIGYVIRDTKNKVDEDKVAFVQLPRSLPRLIKIDAKSGYHFVLLEQVIKAYSSYLFPGLDILTSNTFKVTRDADVEIAEDEADDLLKEIAEQIKQRKWGRVAVRLEVSERMPSYLLNLLIKFLELTPDDVYYHNRPLHMTEFMELLNIDIRHIKDIPFQTCHLPEFQLMDINVFDAIKKKDLMVYHPFDSFSNSVLKFLNQAADDENVLTIKITLYRIGFNSPIVTALKRAAERGKQVTAFVELKARFDEENNIIWARELEHVGVHVIYGVIGLKTHCKIAMIVRREDDGLRTYLHLSTGNYNHITARIYTDVGMFTARREFEKDAINLFNYLTGYSHYENWENFIVAPINLRQKIFELIQRETDLHTDKNPGCIFIKMNSLAHKDVITELYKASRKGVKIKLLVRGVCCLRAGIEGLSENIEVRSIIGRFLEHSRIFYFKNGGAAEIYLASADWMTRNLHNRVELMYPVKDEDLKRRLKKMLDIYWSDNKKSWKLLADGSYERIEPSENENPISAQEYFLEKAKRVVPKLGRKISV